MLSIEENVVFANNHRETNSLNKLNIESVPNWIFTIEYMRELNKLKWKI